MARVTPLSLRTVPCSSSGDQRPQVLLLTPFYQFPCHQSPLCRPFPFFPPSTLSNYSVIFVVSGNKQASGHQLCCSSTGESYRNLDTCLFRSQGTRRAAQYLGARFSQEHSFADLSFYQGRILASVRDCLDGSGGLWGSVRCILPCCCWVGPLPPSVLSRCLLISTVRRTTPELFSGQPGPRAGQRTNTGLVCAVKFSCDNGKSGVYG